MEAHADDATSTAEEARAILLANDRGGYTVPTEGLYPFQWNWDSGFAAMGFSTFDEPRGWQEIETLLQGQWADGMVPHIVFHVADDRYFPGPDVWAVDHVPKTSGLTQPPILAIAVRYMLERAKDEKLAAEAAKLLFPKLLAYQRWFHAARDPDGTGLIASYHPWETGMDNSPAWDAPLAAVPIDPMPSYQRRDISHVGADQRPKNADYDRYMTLVHRFRAMGYDPARMQAESPFKIADVGTNAILCRADKDLLAIAERLDLAGREEISGWIERGRAGLERLWSPNVGGYRSRDLIAGRSIDVGTSASFLPLFAGDLDQSRARLLAADIERWRGKVRFAVPSTDPAAGAFEPKRYWRGPVWLVVNWMIADGLARHGAEALATAIRDNSQRLVRTNGLWEYYDPTSGEGLGGQRFTWAAAIALIWGRSPPSSQTG